MIARLPSAWGTWAFVQRQRTPKKKWGHWGHWVHSRLGPPRPGLFVKSAGATVRPVSPL
jgi:hypothetical protein